MLQIADNTSFMNGGGHTRSVVIWLEYSSRRKQGQEKTRKSPSKSVCNKSEVADHSIEQGQFPKSLGDGRLPRSIILRFLRRLTATNDRRVSKEGLTATDLSSLLKYSKLRRSRKFLPIIREGAMRYGKQLFLCYPVSPKLAWREVNTSFAFLVSSRPRLLMLSDLGDLLANELLTLAGCLCPGCHSNPCASMYSITNFQFHT